MQKEGRRLHLRGDFWNPTAHKMDQDECSGMQYKMREIYTGMTVSLIIRIYGHEKRSRCPEKDIVVK